MVTRRRLLIGSTAVLGTLGFGAAGATAWASTRRSAHKTLLGGGLPLPNGTVVPVDYLSRSNWGADESWRNWPAGPEEWTPDLNDYQKIKYRRYPVQAITVHHTAGNTPASPAAAAQEIRNIYHDQAVNRGWGDIGYNLLIDPFGVVYEGRHSVGDSWPVFGPEGLTTTGAHVGGYNTGNIGVCLLGDFRLGALPTPAARAALVTVLAALCRLCNLDPLATVSYVNPVPAASPNDTNTPDTPLHYTTRSVLGVSGHRDWAATDCPGSTFYPTLGQIRAEVGSVLTPPPAPQQRVRPSATVPPGEPGMQTRPAPSSVPTPPTAGRTR